MYVLRNTETDNNSQLTLFFQLVQSMKGFQRYFIYNI